MRASDMPRIARATAPSSAADIRARSAACASPLYDVTVSICVAAASIARIDTTQRTEISAQPPSRERARCSARTLKNGLDFREFPAEFSRDRPRILGPLDDMRRDEDHQLGSCLVVGVCREQVS